MRQEQDQEFEWVTTTYPIKLNELRCADNEDEILAYYAYGHYEDLDAFASAVLEVAPAIYDPNDVLHLAVEEVEDEHGFHFRNVEIQTPYSSNITLLEL